MSLRRLRSGLVTVILLAVTIRILWWSIEPALPYLIVLLVLVCILGTLVYRTTRW